MGTKQQLIKVKCKPNFLDGMDIQLPNDVTCLSMVFDNKIKFYTHIKRLAAKCFYHLHQMHSSDAFTIYIRCILFVKQCIWYCSIKRLLTYFCVLLINSWCSNAFTTRRTDYCKRVFCGVTVTHLHPLQPVFDATACIIPKKCKYDLIRATIHDVLHWLLIQQRI